MKIPSLIATICFCTLLCRSEIPQPPVASRLHVVSIHVPDHQTFDAIFSFLSDTLKLPKVYGELNTNTQDKAQRLYAGFSVGNAYLEPCGPYSSDAPFTPGQPARFHGLTFATPQSIPASAAQLKSRGITNSGVIGPEGSTQYVYSTDPRLTGGKLAVSLWQIADKNEKVNLEFLAPLLLQAKGGVLGVMGLQEVRVGFSSSTNLTLWRKFCAPFPIRADLCQFPAGPALRFSQAEEPKIEAIVLKVASLAKAKEAVTRLGMLGAESPGTIELNTSRTYGLKIVLTE